MMYNIRFLILILGLSFFGYSQNGPSTSKNVLKDKKEIQKLIRKVLTWSESKGTIELLPVLTDSKDSVYIGFDMAKHKSNLDKLKRTNFFAVEFIDNYNQIILTLDKKLRNGEYEEWLVGDLPTFIFANDVDPWWSGQDHFPWKLV